MYDELVKDLRENHDKYFARDMEAADAIEKLTADVRPVVRGKWELDSDGLPVCSECGEVALQRLFIKLPKLIPDIRMMRSNFCPNCGADNRKEAEA